MTWIPLLGIAALLAALAAVLGLSPQGARGVGSTQLMGVARKVLLVAAVLFLVMAVVSLVSTTPG